MNDISPLPESITTFERGWIIRLRPPEKSPPRKIFLLIHGWTGDERSMEIFGRKLPTDSLILYPRGPVSTPEGGYGWTSLQHGEQVGFDSLAPTVKQLMGELEKRLVDMNLPPHPFNIAGFSQGAALAYVFAFLYPERVNRLAVLAGFLPPGYTTQQLSGLRGKHVYIAHGIRDDTIPFEHAIHAQRELEGANALVEFCPSQSGHKLPPACYNALLRFLNAD